MTFNERDAIQIRMQQIFLERQSLQEEYQNLLSRLREIDERDLRQSSTKVEASLESRDDAGDWNENNTMEPNKGSLEWEDCDLGDKEQEKIDTKEYDKRLNELQAFLDEEND